MGQIIIPNCDIFSPRELSLLVWLGLTFTGMMFNKSIRNALGSIFKLLWDKKIGTIFIMLIVYVTATLFLINKVWIYDITHLKDTIVWFISVALVLLFSIGKNKSTFFFKEIVKDSFKLTMVIEFFINFYTFSLQIELILIPIVIFLILMLTFSDKDKKYDQANKFFYNILAIVGLILFGFVTYKTFYNYQNFFTIRTLFSLLLPTILTIILIPFLYMMALYVNYELVFTRINFMTNNDMKRKLLKNEILLLAGFNLNRLAIINKKLNKFDVYHSDNLRIYLKALINKNNPSV